MTTKAIANTGQTEKKSNARRGGGQVQAFAFGDAEPVLDKSTMMGMMFAWQNGKWYEPPISLTGLARSLELSTYHNSAIMLKVNLLAKHFQPSPMLSRAEFKKMAKDFIVTGNGYFQIIANVLGNAMQMVHVPALYARRGVEEGRYFWVPNFKQEEEFARGSIAHLIESDQEQEIYGKPQWFAALQPAILNERATLFRRAYYDNGGHMGYILYNTETTINDEDSDAIREAVKNSRRKAGGNFKNLYVHAPGGSKDGIQVMPISEIAAKDDFMQIKTSSRDEVLAAHRTPPQMIGVVPTNNGGFGDAGMAEQIFFRNEIEPIMQDMAEFNTIIGSEVITFDAYQPLSRGGAAA